jgi:hypothetical protein
MAALSLALTIGREELRDIEERYWVVRSGVRKWGDQHRMNVVILGIGGVGRGCEREWQWKERGVNLFEGKIWIIIFMKLKM